MGLEELIGKIKSCDRCKNIVFNGLVNVRNLTLNVESTRRVFLILLSVYL